MTRPDTCPECGEPLDDADFGWRADLIAEALDGAEADDAGALLAMFMAIWLSGWDAGDRRLARRDIVKDVDRLTRHYVIQACDA